MRQRVGFMMLVKVGFEEAYEDCHRAGNPVNTEIRHACERAGFRNYSIFRGGPDGRLLFGYFETDDLEASLATLAADPANAPWQLITAPMMEIAATFDGHGAADYLSEIFHVD